MTFADVAFLLGPVGAVLVVPVAAPVMLALANRLDWVASWVFLLCSIIGTSWVLHAGLLVAKLHRINNYLPVPALLEWSLNVSMLACAFAVVALTIAMIVACFEAGIRSRRTNR